VALFADGDYQPLVLTIFAGEVTPEVLSGFARRKQARWGMADTAVVDLRRAENVRAAHILGCHLRELGFPDAIYRGDRYTNDQELFGPIVPVEGGLIDLLVDEVLSLPERRPQATFFVPLGVGCHVDHQLVFLTGCHLASEGYRVYMYEDCPYCIHTPASLKRRIRQLQLPEDSAIHVNIEQALGRRLDAIGCYKSQLPVIFRFTDDYRRAVTAFASAGGQPLERFWPLAGSRYGYHSAGPTLTAPWEKPK
jgi:LmbE family N-acetylglucosaminyl deacetylase